MYQSKIPYTKPSITSLEIDYANDAVTNGWGDKCYEYIVRFEENFKSYLGVEFAIATSSCTGALHLGMHALGIGEGDEVIMADTNWIATASPIFHLGAKPILVDIKPDTWCLDPQCVEDAITPRTKAIVAVHLYGNLCDMDALRDIANRYKLFLIEDSAEGIGSEYKGQKAGSIGKFGTFSFHGTKTLTTGEGGMFVTNDPALYAKALTLSNHGRTQGNTKQFWPDMFGYKFKMSNVQAAIGCAQLERIDELIAKKRYIFEFYATKFKSLPLAMNPEYSGSKNGYWMPTCVFPSGYLPDRQVLIEYLNHNNIDARVFFWPLSTTSMLAKNKAVNKPYLSESICHRALNFPSFHDMTDEQLTYVADLLLEFLGHK